MEIQELRFIHDDYKSPYPVDVRNCTLVKNLTRELMIGAAIELAADFQPLSSGILNIDGDSAPLKLFPLEVELDNGEVVFAKFELEETVMESLGLKRRTISNAEFLRWNEFLSDASLRGRISKILKFSPACGNTRITVF